MVIVLLTATMALVVVNFFPFENALAERPASIQTKRAVAEAHRLARTEKERVFLHYDEDSESLVVSDESGTECVRYGFPEGTDATVSFYRILPEKEIRDEPDFEAEEETTDLLAFQSYGVADPFQIELETEKNAVVFRFDPFSGLSWEEEELH